MGYLSTIYRLGLKEFFALLRDPVMLFLIIWAFSANIYIASQTQADLLHKVAIAVVDGDRSQLSQRLIDAFYPPDFLPPDIVSPEQADEGMDRGRYTFQLVIPPHFQRDTLDGKAELQLNVDATQASQAFIGTGYIQNIANLEISEFIAHVRGDGAMPVNLVTHALYNPNLSQDWYAAVMEIINNVTLLSIILAGAALIREREHGTIEHLLVMPLTPFEIMAAKIWSMGLVVLVAVTLSLEIVVKKVIGVAINGSVALFLAGTILHLFATTSLGIFLATLARSMPQFGLLMILTLIPLMILSGALTPMESMPQAVQWIMQLAPNTHFVNFAQAILYRGAGIEVVWPRFLIVFVIGLVLFTVALLRLRSTIGKMA